MTHWLTGAIPLSITFATSAVGGQSSNIPANLRFELGAPGTAPPAWFVPTNGWTATIETVDCKEGKQCARLSPNQDSDRGPFGNLMQAVDAAPYRGKTIRLRAAIKAGNISERGPQMWLRVDRSNQQMGFFNNMDDRPIRDTKWAYYDITGSVAGDAVLLNYGFMVSGTAIAWIDDASIEIVGSAAATALEPARPLTECGLENLVAFAQLFGYVRFFHPSDQAASIDWERLAVKGVRAVESAASAEELTKILQALFDPIAPTLRVFRSGETPPIPEELKKSTDIDGLFVVAWKHSGYGTGNPQSAYRSERVHGKIAPALVDRILGNESADQLPNPGEPLRLALGGGVECLLPIALYVRNNTTIPQPTSVYGSADSVISLASESYLGDDRATRLADVILSWTIMEHFYPYFDVVQADWPMELRRALDSAARDKNEREFLNTLRRMIAALHDGHGHVNHSSDSAWAGLPLIWDWIENQLVITAVSFDAPRELVVGDKIRRINGRLAAIMLKEAESLISGATPQSIRHRALGDLRRGQAGDRVDLEIEHADGSVRSTVLSFATTNTPPTEPRPDKVCEVRPDIFYVDIDRISDDDFRAALPKLEKANGIVFDFRGYPRNLSAWVLFPHLIEQPVVSQRWLIPMIQHPDRAKWQWPRRGEWNIAPAAPYLKAKKIFIIDGRAISYAESCLGIIEHYKLGELVGEPTAGTNGNINPFTLPGGYHVVWTGMKVLKHDGSRHHGVGILPTIPVKRTIRGVAEGRDELLEKAIESLAK